MQLYQHYQERLQQHGLCADPAQRPILEALQHLADALAAPPVVRWRRWLGQAAAPIPGLYIWGSVGRGKTWLMDLFFEHLPEQRKQRLHFHRFMQQVHQGLAQLRHKKEPLDQLAARMAADWRVLCLDEFHVIDIGDAMIFAGLLRGLFQRGVILVTTSNVPPADLYLNGLQRDQFLPAIALLEQHTRVLAAQGEQDHRQAVAAVGQAYQYPLNVGTTQRLQHMFRQLANEVHDLAGRVSVQGRQIAYRQRTSRIIWFEFRVLCGPPRSQHDYIALADRYAVVFISDIPVMTADDDDPMRRFIMLIDELYDRQKQVVISAAAPAGRLYQGERLAFEFQRTLSRLHEMQRDFFAFD